MYFLRFISFVNFGIWIFEFMKLGNDYKKGSGFLKFV